jgi:RNA polymerase sigma factor (sigma-70 family)
MPEISVSNAQIAEYKAAPKTSPRKKRLLDRLVRDHDKLIKRLVRKAAFAERSSEDLEDLFQAGCIGFVTAVEKFDPGRGCSISTYAAHWIRHEVQQATRAARPVRLPRIRLTNEERAGVAERLKNEPDLKASDCGISEAKLDQVRHSMGIRFVSTETPKGARAFEAAAQVAADDGLSSIDTGEAYRRLFRACAVMSRGEVHAASVALGIKGEPHARKYRADQLAWPWRDRFGRPARLDALVTSAAERIAGLS